MIGEIIGEAILYLLFYTLFFWTGFVFLELVTFGKLGLATPEKFGTKTRKVKGKKRRSLWIYAPKKGRGSTRELKPEVTATIGTFVWIAGIVTYLCLQ